MPIRLKFKAGAEVVMNDLWLSKEEYASMTRGELLRMVEMAIEDEFRDSGTLDDIVESIEYLDHSSGPKERTLEQIEKNHIIRVLHDHGGKRKETAAALGITASTLYRKLKDYGIAGPE